MKNDTVGSNKKGKVEGIKMKGRFVFAIIFISFGLLSGCTSDALSEYLEAAKKTSNIEKGNIKLAIQAELDFETEGLSYEQKRDLSYFDQIDIESNTQFDSSAEAQKVISKTYFNFGGVGFDSVFYMNGDQAYLRMPIIDGYIRLDSFLQDKEEMAFSDSGDLFLPIYERWMEILGQEDVVKGEKTYVLTDQGQIKASTYSIVISRDQLKVLGDEMFKVLRDKRFFEMAVKEGYYKGEMKEEDIIAFVEEYAQRIVLESFEGNAYVDFDGRIVKEEYSLKLGFEEPNKGELKAIDLSLKMEHTMLGEELDFDFPVVEEDEWIKMDETNVESLLPEGIFN